MTDAIRWYPVLPVVGYPNKIDVINQKLEHNNVEHNNLLQSKHAEQKMRDLQFELYCKAAEKNRLRIEIFANRSVNLLC